MALSDERSGRRFLTVAIPVLADPGVPTSSLVAVIAVRVKPEAGLYRLLTEETVPRSDETLLFRLDPARRGYLSPLKDESAGWAATHRSLEALGALAA